MNVLHCKWDLCASTIYTTCWQSWTHATWQLDSCLDIVLSVLPRFTASVSPFGIFKHFIWLYASENANGKWMLFKKGTFVVGELRLNCRIQLYVSGFCVCRSDPLISSVYMLNYKAINPITKKNKPELRRDHRYIVKKDSLFKTIKSNQNIFLV